MDQIFRCGHTDLADELRHEHLKGFRDGTDRVSSPADTWCRVSPHAARMGITRVADIAGPDRIGIPVYEAFRPLSRNRAVSQGKGLTADAAPRVVALGRSRCTTA